LTARAVSRWGLSVDKAEGLSTLQVCVRAVVGYIVVLIAYVRFAKKGVTTQMLLLISLTGSYAARYEMAKSTRLFLTQGVLPTIALFLLLRAHFRPIIRHVRRLDHPVAIH
jgi:hypothetical protein